MTEQPALQQPRAEVSSVRVSLVTSVRLLPHQAAVVPIQLPAECSLEGPPLPLEPDSRGELQMEDALVQPSKDGLAQVVISNRSGAHASWKVEQRGCN